MASAGGDDGRRDERERHPLRPPGERRYERNLNPDDIGNQARFLLTRFIHDRLEQNGNDAPEADNLRAPDTPAGPPVEHIRQVAACLKKIGDELDGDENLQRIIGRIRPDSPKQTFLEVAKEIFADGNFNWGRVVALFYFAYKMAVKTLEAKFEKLVPVVQMIVEWVVSFITDYVAGWIIERGGWDAIQEYFGTPSYQAVGIFLAGILCTVFVAYRKL